MLPIDEADLLPRGHKLKSTVSAKAFFALLAFGAGSVIAIGAAMQQTMPASVEIGGWFMDEVTNADGDVGLMRVDFWRGRAEAAPPEKEPEVRPLTDQQRHLLCYLKSKIPIDLSPRSFVETGNFATCAVVSNSGALRTRKRGREIDNHTTVFRFNDAPIKGYEKIVGTKDTVRFTGKVGFTRSLRRIRRGTKYVWVDFEHGPLDSRLKASGAGVELAGRPEVRVEEALKDLFADRWWKVGRPKKSFHPTTGALGMLVALTLCNVTDAYDMSPSAASRTAPYHYYKWRNWDGRDITADDNTWHKTFIAERNLWASLSVTSREDVKRTGKIRIPGFNTVSCEGVNLTAKPRMFT